MTITTQQLELIESEIARQPDAVQQFYRAMIKKGESPRFAHMCAIRRAPETRYSDKTFNKQRRIHMNSMSPMNRKKYLEMAKKAGISTQGKFYVGGLGRATDPMAWVSTVDEARDVCRAKNLTAEGLVSHVGTKTDPPKRARMANDIVSRYVARELAKDPQRAAKCKADPAQLAKVQAEVVDRHAPPGS